MSDLQLLCLGILVRVGDIDGCLLGTCGQACDYGLARSSVVHDVYRALVLGLVIECRCVDTRLVHRKRDGEGIGRHGQLAQVVETLGGSQRAVVTQDAVALQQRVIGCELPLQDAQRLADGTQARV